MIPIKPILPLIVTLMLAVPASSQPCPSLQVRNPDGNYIIPGVQGDIPYSGDLALDAYVQLAAGRRPSVVVIHGGALSAGGRSAHIGPSLGMVTPGGGPWVFVGY